MIDTAYLDDLYEAHGAGFLREIIDLFLLETPKILKEIQASRQVHDLETLAHRAHKLKGMALSMSFTPLSQVAEKLELAAEHKTELQEIQGDFEHCLGDTLKALQAYTEQRF